jgi:hypothetical protein
MVPIGKTAELAENALIDLEDTEAQLFYLRVLCVDNALI